MLGVQETRARVILVLRECIWNAAWVILHMGSLECIWNAPTVSLVLPAFNDTSSLGSPPRQVFYPRGFHLG